MPRKKQNHTRCKALTLLEMVIALAIVSILFAVILPIFTTAGNSWQARQSSSEAIQNGRILVDYINAQLSKAVKVTDVSDASITNGYIEFEDATGTVCRFDIAASNYVQFGEIGSQSELAGPVSKLQFTCYASSDLSTPITDPEEIRIVKVEAVLDNPSALGKDKTFVTSAYLQTNEDYEIAALLIPFEFDTVKGKTPALAKIDDTHFLNAYAGDGDDGWATVMIVDPETSEITKGMSYEFDTEKGKTPALAQIDTEHYLCAYVSGGGKDDEGWAKVLTVDTGSWAISGGPSFGFDTMKGKTPALSQVDSTHYLCAYAGDGDDGWATVLTVNPATWTITKEISYEYDSVKGKTPALAQIDTSHYLCAYAGDGDDGWATVLTVDTGTWGITKGTPFEFDGIKGKDPALAQIDSTHYLCTYAGDGDDGMSTILTVDTSNWTITKGPTYEYNTTRGKKPALAVVDSGNFLCAYEYSVGGWSNALSLNSSTWEINANSTLVFDGVTGKAPALTHISENKYLCVYEGPDSDGWSIVITALKIKP